MPEILEYREYLFHGGISLTDSGSTRGGLEGATTPPPALEAFSPPPREFLGSCRSTFGKIMYEKCTF